MQTSKKPLWRLRKTLSRNVSFRPIEQEDIKYLWAAYKKGCLESMGGVFADTGMSGEEFEAQFIAEIQTNYHAAWILLSDIPNKGQLQVGAVLGFYSHPNPKMAPFMIVGDIIWFPWATPRVKIESAVNFFNKIRSEIPMMEYASEESKKFFEMIARHGIMRRIGTTFSVKRDEPMAVFETRAP